MKDVAKMTLTDWEQPIRALSHATFRRRHLRIAIGTLPRKWEGVRFSAGADADTLDDVEKGTNRPRGVSFESHFGRDD